MSQNRFLSESRVLELIEGKKIKIGRIFLYITSWQEVSLIKYSRLYEDGKSYWFGISPSFLDTIDNNNVTSVYFVLGYEGVVKLPVKELKAYLQNADVSYMPETTRIRHYHIRVKFEQELLLYNSVDEMLITPYLLYDEELILEDLNDKSKDQVRLDAESFQDYEKQYSESERKSRHRKESRAQKERIAILENHTCQICGFRYEYLNKKGKKAWIIHVDHITDKAKGGGELMTNLWVLCPNCHSKKTCGAIAVDQVSKAVYENGMRVEIIDNHLGW